MSRISFACLVCGGNPNSLFSKGAIAGAIFLVAVVVFVLGGILWTGIVWTRRAKRMHDHL